MTESSRSESPKPRHVRNMFVLCAANDTSSCSMDLAPPPHIRSLLMANRHQSFTNTLLCSLFVGLALGAEICLPTALLRLTLRRVLILCSQSTLSFVNTALMNGKFHDNKPIEYLVNGVIVYDVGKVTSDLGLTTKLILHV